MISDFEIFYIIYKVLCGDYPEHIEKHSWKEQMKLGTVTLSNGQTYTSCRELCKASYPDFEFYHKFVNYQSCSCIKMKTGYEIQIKKHGAYTFGYATACGNILSSFSLNICKWKTFIHKKYV